MTRPAHALDAHFQTFSTMLTVADLAKSEAFYVSALGFHTTETQDGLRRLERPGASLYLVTQSPPTPDKPGVTLAPPPAPERPPVNLVFRVADVRAAYAALSALGVAFLNPPRQPPWGGWRCFLQDPDGYLIELEQP
jgi:catechol 2,3-dioxygenase-like lactoylglutathione lyase family enzyme